jgi:hypothetical protein
MWIDQRSGQTHGMHRLRNWLGALALVAAGVAGQAAPAAATVEPVGPPTCSATISSDLYQATASCFNGSPIYTYRVTLLCILPDTSGYYSVSPWTPTSQTIVIACTQGGWIIWHSIEVRQPA